MTLRIPALRWAALVLSVTMGCAVNSDDESEPRELVWDLSQGHTTDRVEWPNELSAFAFEDGALVRLTLPEGRVYEERVDKVAGRRVGATIVDLTLIYPAMSTEDAYKLARRLGREWEMDLTNIDRWYERRMAQRRAGDEDLSDTAFTGTPHSDPIGAGGPRPAIEVLNSFNDERPVRVNLVFVWPTPE